MKSRFDWKAAYFHLVSLVAMIFFLFAAVSAGHGILRLFFPALSMDSHAWESVESFQAYKRQFGDVGPKPARPGPDGADTPVGTRLTEEELKQGWEEHKRLAIEGQKRRGLWDLLESLAAMAVAAPILIFHRRQAKRLRDDPEPIDS